MNLSAQSNGFFPTVIHWKHQHTFYHSFTPDDYSFPLYKLGQEISYLYNLHFFQGLRAPKKRSELWFPPCSAACCRCAEAITALELGSLRSHGAPANTRGGDDNVSLLPSCGRATTRQSLWYFTKNPSIFRWRLFALGSSPGLFSLLKCSCIYQDNRCFYVKGAWIRF